jgi:tripeptidyl-peptidase-1
VPCSLRLICPRSSSYVFELRIYYRIKTSYSNLQLTFNFQISTPSHPNYGDYFSGHELHGLLRPASGTTDIATVWLQEYNITSIEDDSDFLLFRTNVDTANRLLNSTFGWYFHSETGETLLRTTKYYLPDSVKGSINWVQPTTRFGSTKAMASLAQIIHEGPLSDGKSKWVDVKDSMSSGNNIAVRASCNMTITPQYVFPWFRAFGLQDPIISGSKPMTCNIQLG